MAEQRFRNRIVGEAELDPAALVANPANWRTHPRDQERALEAALDSVGWVQRVIVNRRTGHMVDGHLRAELAVQAGEHAVPVLYVDLDEAEERVVLASLDPIGAMAATDKDALATLLGGISAESDPIRALLASVAQQTHISYNQASEEDPGAEIDRAEELREKWQTERGQLWLIPSRMTPGREHRLLCGDATSEENVAALMDEAQAALFATDPPYGIDYDSAGLHRNGSHYDAILQDDLKNDAYQAWLESVFRVWVEYLAPDAAWYLWHPMLTQGYFAAAAAAAAGVMISRQIIWTKPQMIFGRGDYHWQHELCFYGWRQSHRPPFYGERNQTTVWAIDYDGNRNDRDHPTQKPVALWIRPVLNHTRAGAICAEPFAGSGTQYVAAEQTGRLCYGLEIEPKYVAVTLERLAGLGLEPRRG
jgi:DNA modification methylase